MKLALICLIAGAGMCVACSSTEDKLNTYQEVFTNQASLMCDSLPEYVAPTPEMLDVLSIRELSTKALMHANKVCNDLE